MSINDKQTNYTNSFSYEYFVRRAYQFNKKLASPSNQEFLNLIEAENGNKHSWLPKLEKQLDDIKNKIRKAIEIFISKSKDSDQIEKLEELLEKVNYVNSSGDVFEIVDYGLEITQSFKN